MDFMRTSRNVLIAVAGAVGAMMASTVAVAQVDVNELISQLAPGERPVTPGDSPNANIEIIYTAGQRTNSNPIRVWGLTRYNDAVYFIDNGKLMRVADGGAVSEEISFGRRYANSPVVFDEALYFTGIAPQGRWTRSLHRLDANGATTSIAGTEDIDEFVVYRDSIYFLKLTEFEQTSCLNRFGFPETAAHYEIYRLNVDGGSGVVEKTNLDVYACDARASKLKSTQFGLAFTVAEGVDPLKNAMYVLRDPVVDSSVPSQSHVYRVFNHRDASAFTEFEFFDGHLFYADDHFFQDTGGLGYGPFADPGRGVTPAGVYRNYETELYRAKSGEQAVYFNVRQLNAEDLEWARTLEADGEIFANGPYVSSDPRYFIVTPSGLYFTAYSEKSQESFGFLQPELFHIASGTSTPRRIQLPSPSRSASTYQRRVLGESAGKLWVLARIGDNERYGVDLHFLVDGVAVPLGFDTAIEGPASDTGLRYGFHGFYDSEWVTTPNGMTVTASDSRGYQNLYRITPVSATQINEVTTTATIGGNAYTSRPGLEVSNNTRLEHQCTVTNNTNDSLTNVSMRLDRRRLARSPDEKNGKRVVVKTCSAALLGVSESLTCSYRKRPRVDTWKHRCVTKVTNGEGVKVKARKSAYVTRAR